MESELDFGSEMEPEPEIRRTMEAQDPPFASTERELAQRVEMAHKQLLHSRHPRDLKHTADAARPDDNFYGRPIIERYTDSQGRSMLITRTMDQGGESGMDEKTRFYEIFQADSTQQGFRQIGRVTITFQRSHDQSIMGGDPDSFEKVYIRDVHVEPAFRRAGNGARLLKQVERDAAAVQAQEIHGVVPDEEARSFWRHMVKYGYVLNANESHVSKRLRA